jgi:hypothetical protein
MMNMAGKKRKEPVYGGKAGSLRCLRPFGLVVLDEQRFYASV